MNENSLYEAALAYAAQKHRGQLRKGGQPYITHPVAVAEKLRKWGYGIDYQLAGLFHDLLEDTDATEERILELSNECVLEAVKLLTKKNGYIMADYIANIRANEIAFAVKGADRLHNLESAFEADIIFRRKYIDESRKWYMDFRPEIPGAVAAIEETVKYNITEYHTEDFYICFCDTDGIDVNCDMSMFSEYRKKRLDALRCTGAKRCSIGAEMMLNHAIKRCMPETEIPVQYKADENGKPHFTTLDGVYFSLSHSGTKAACMLAHRSCGIDIQEIRAANKKLADRYFTDAEQSMCTGDGFTRIWARKEAAAKADGRGIAVGFDSFDVCGECTTIGGREYNITDISAPEGYVMAAAVKNDI